MRIKIRFLSIYRDIVGSSELDIVIEKDITVAQLIDMITNLYPKLKNILNEIPPIIFVDGETATDLERIIKASNEDIEIALAPPASGGSNIVVKLFERDISIDDIINSITTDNTGSIAIFVGTVKGVVNDHKVYELFYEAYEPYVVDMLRRIAQEELAKRNIQAVHIYHRTGSAKPREKTIVIAVSAMGRREALETLSSILERVKKEAPIYKLEKRDDGEYWIIGDGKRTPRTISV